MFPLSRKRRLLRAVAVAVTVLGFCVATSSTKPAEAAFVTVGVGTPSYYYTAAPACVYYYPYGCYGYPGPYYAPAAVVAGGWGWGGWGWGRPCWGCGRFFHDGRFFFRDGRFSAMVASSTVTAAFSVMAASSIVTAPLPRS